MPPERPPIQSVEWNVVPPRGARHPKINSDLAVRTVKVASPVKDEPSLHDAPDLDVRVKPNVAFLVWP